ncbi:MAG: VCBS repeat-containing protein [Planctomycetota bacterium]|nr:VCBS repeat-containing protein [Planctomycetota bacterium]
MRSSARWTVALVLLAGVVLGPGPVRADEDPEPVEIVLEDVTEAAGLAGVGGDRFSFGDYDADGDPDLLVNGKTLLRNDTTAFGKDGAAIRFTDVSKETGIAKGPGGGACWVDLNGDGRLDVVTSNGAVKIQVKPGAFENRAAAWGLPKGTKGSTVGVGDIDGDHRPDVLFGGGENWNDGNAVMFPRLIYRNVDGQGFEDLTKHYGLETPRYGRAVVFADYDTDGDQDVYLGNYRLQPNELLVNEDGTLKDRAKELGVQGRFDPKQFFDEKTKKRYGWQYGHTIASSWADLDGDGDLDLWVSNLVHKFVGQSTYQGKPWYDIRGYVCDDSAIYRNDGAPYYGFTDMRGQSDIPLRPLGDRSVFRGDELWSNAACGDLDGDGLPEVFVAQVYTLPYSHALLFRNRGGFKFREISGSVGLRRFNSYGGAFADLDGDGDLDLVCGGSPAPKGKRGICVLRNDTEPGPWIGFRLEPPSQSSEVGAPEKGTTDLGAQVIVETDKGRLVRQVESCMGSHAQQNENVLRFGLRGRKLLRAFVRWPGGLIQDLGTPEPGRVHDVSVAKVLKRIRGRIPSIQIASVPNQGAEGSLFNLSVKGRKPSGAKWTADCDGDGVFETKGTKIKGPFRGARAELRVRLGDPKRGWAVEKVLRFDVPAKR